MKLYLTYDFDQVFKKLVEEHLSHLNIDYDMIGTRDLNLKSDISPSKLADLSKFFSKYGISVVQDERMELVYRIKETIAQYIQGHDNARIFKISVYLSEKLNQPYYYLSQVFSEETFTSIESFIILKKIDYVKKLLLDSNLSLTEIAFKMDYSSVAHLSNQFKKTTGFTPSSFKNVVEKRRQINKLVS